MAVHLDSKQAILLRLLTDVFGKDNIVFDISLWLLLQDFENIASDNKDFKKLKCLFTILDKNSTPKMVVNFDPLYDKEKYIDMKELEKHQILENNLKEVNITYLVINKDDFEGLTHPKHPVNIVDLFNFKLGLDEE